MDSLRNYDEDDSSAALESAVERWKAQGSDVMLKDVPYSILHLVSRYFPPQKEWKTFAALLGIENIQTLTELEGDALMSGVWPSEVALLYVASQPTSPPATFSDLIVILHSKLLRIDALQRLHDGGQVEEFLQARKRSNLESNKNCANSYYHGSERLGKILEMEDVADIVRKISKNKLTKDSFGSLNVCNVAAALAANNKLSTKGIYHVNAVTVDWNSPAGRKEAEIQKSVVPCKDVRDIPRQIPAKPVVMLTYASDANDVIPDLVSRFWKADMGVVAEYVLQGKGYLESNPITYWETLFKGCHFVVPVISNRYLVDILKPDDTMQGQVVRFVYDLYTRKYVSDGCFNNIVRPLVLSDVEPRSLKNVNPTLRVRWKVWDDVDKLIALVRTGFEASICN